MTRANKKLLTELYLAYQRRERPSVPEHGLIQKYKHTDNSANGLTRCILDYFKFNGWQAERISNTGRMIDNTKVIKFHIGWERTVGTKKWIKGSGRNGTADISATMPINVNGRTIGVSLKIEVKYGKDRQSEDQKSYQKEVEKAGGVYMIARNFDDFLKDLQKML